MARNRQRAKERQAERRAARQAARENTGAVPDAQRRVEAPPEELGRSDFTLEHTRESEEFIGDLQFGDEPYDGDDGGGSGRPPVDDDFADDGADEGPSGPRGIRGGREHEHEHHERGRVGAFLAAVWAELNRVQWPDRQQLTSLTGITLLFVLVVGGYLGFLDAVFSKLVNAIL